MAMDVNITARRNTAKRTEIITGTSGIGRSGEVLKIGPMMKAGRRWSVHSVDVQDHLERVTKPCKRVKNQGIIAWCPKCGCQGRF